MSGVLVCIVGPSGAGKDTLIAGVRQRVAMDDRFVFPRRLVTRQASAAEDHDTVTLEHFLAQQAKDDFALSWSAHGLGYAIPGSVRRDLDAGRVVICNVSRAAIAEARQRFPEVRTVLITAPREVLAERLRTRGREPADDLGRRLEREAALPFPADLTVSNVGAVDTHVSSLVDFLRNVSAGRTV